MISNSQIGTYPLQAIIDQMKTKEERKIIIEAVREHVLEMCQVIFKFISRYFIANYFFIIIF
jgi:hypothetical protein